MINYCIWVYWTSITEEVEVCVIHAPFSGLDDVDAIRVVKVVANQDSSHTELVLTHIGSRALDLPTIFTYISDRPGHSNG